MEPVIRDASAIVNGVSTTLEFDKTSGDDLIERHEAALVPNRVYVEKPANRVTLDTKTERLVLATESAPFIVTNESRKEIIVDHHGQNYIGDMRRTSNHIYFDFESLMSGTNFNYTAGAKWIFTRWGDKWLADFVLTSSTTGRWINRPNHGFRTGTYLTADNAIGTALPGQDTWVSEFNQDQFKLVSDFNLINSTNDNDTLDPSNINTSVRFIPRTATMLVRNIPGYANIPLNYDGQRLIVEYQGGGRFHCEFKYLDEWRHFPLVSGSGSQNYIGSLRNIRGYYQHVPGKVNFRIVAETATDQTPITLDTMANHHMQLPFGLKLENAIEHLLIDNPGTSVENRGVPFPVGRMYYQITGVRETYGAPLYIRSEVGGGTTDDRGWVYPEPPKDVFSNDAASSHNISPGGTLHWEIGLPYESIRRI